MRTNILFLSLLFVITSCSSVSKTGDNEADALIVHLSKPVVVIGQDFDPRFDQDGLVNGEYVAIGSITYPDSGSSYGDTGMLFSAKSRATNNLLNSAPTDYKKIVQSTLSSMIGDNGKVDETTISITEVKALTGMKSNFKDAQCVRRATPNNSMKFTISKECRVLVRVPASELMNAYAFTLDAKYGINNNKLKGMLEEQLMDTIKVKPLEKPIERKTASIVEKLPVAKAYQGE